MPPPPNLAILLAQMQYPGATEFESDVIRAWLRAHGAEFDSIEFNVRLGRGGEPLEDFDEPTRRAQRALTQKRADIIAHVGGTATIIEVKIKLGLSALGQLIAYRQLYLDSHPEEPPAALLAIARAADGDVRAVLERNGVRFEFFPRDSA